MRSTLSNKILIIDDNIIFSHAVRYHLLNKEYRVEICNSCSEFRDTINLEGFDLILLDLKLKDGYGLDILEDILKKDLNKKVIVISSYLNNKNILEAKKLGAYKCIEKNSNLFKKLDTFLDSSFESTV